MANAAAIPLGTAGGAIFPAGASGAELVIDVNGYYVESSARAGVASVRSRPAR